MRAMVNIKGVFRGPVHLFRLADIRSWHLQSKRCRNHPVNRYIPLFWGADTSRGMSRRFICVIRSRTGKSRPSLV